MSDAAQKAGGLMIIPRRTVLVGSGAALALAAISPICAAEATNSLASVIAADGNSIKAIRVAGGDRISARLVDIDVSADRSPYPLFKQFFTQNANQVAVYSAPPGHLTTALAAEPQLIYMAAGVMSLKAGSIGAIASPVRSSLSMPALIIANRPAQEAIPRSKSCWRTEA